MDNTTDVATPKESYQIQSDNTPSNNYEYFETHKVEVSEEDFDSKKDNKGVNNALEHGSDISDDIQESNSRDDQKESENEANSTNGNKHSMKSFFTNISEAQNEDCNQDDLSISFDDAPEVTNNNYDAPAVTNNNDDAPEVTNNKFFLNSPMLFILLFCGPIFYDVQ